MSTMFPGPAEATSSMANAVEGQSRRLAMRAISRSAIARGRFDTTARARLRVISPRSWRTSGVSCGVGVICTRRRPPPAG